MRKGAQAESPEFELKGWPLPARKRVGVFHTAPRNAPFQWRPELVA